MVDSSRHPGQPCTQVFLSKQQSTELPKSGQLSHLSSRDSSQSSQPLYSLTLFLERGNHSTCALRLNYSSYWLSAQTMHQARMPRRFIFKPVYAFPSEQPPLKCSRALFAGEDDHYSCGHWLTDWPTPMSVQIDDNVSTSFHFNQLASLDPF